MHLLGTTRQKLDAGQRLKLGGCFDPSNLAYVISKQNLVQQPEPDFSSDALEADIRLWRHVHNSPGKKILIYSPDTDVYNIGLGLTTTKQILVQLNLPQYDDHFVNLGRLQKDLQNDSDLIWLKEDKVISIVHSLFTATGCDYISYFHGFGKKTVLSVFFHHCDFITGTSGEGSLDQIYLDNQDKGFLAFIRLVGTMYFKKHFSAFYSLFGYELPDQMLKSISSSDNKEKHYTFINNIRGVVNERVTCEDEKVASTTALWRHWQRSCWVLQMWQNSRQSKVYQTLPPPESSGWLLEDSSNNYSIDWECEEVKAQVKDVVDFLTRGCSCKKNQCKTSRCGCRRNQKHCGPGCECVLCTNTPVPILDNDISTSEEDESTEEGSESETDEELIHTEIITEPWDEIVIEQ